MISCNLDFILDDEPARRHFKLPRASNMNLIFFFGQFFVSVSSIESKVALFLFRDVISTL